jgi:mannose-6-phosphate isomerase-like protein (cupin superfamily)
VRFTLAKLNREMLEAAAPLFTNVYARESSIVQAYPYLRNKKFSADDLINFSTNFVQVFGAAPEPMHIHSSTIVVQVVQGKGVLLYEQDGKSMKGGVGEGDMAVIPVGAPHFFHGDPLVVYTGIEMGPVIDYQKHHYVDNRKVEKNYLRVN